MAKMTVNFAEVEGGFEAIPEGRYPAAIEKVEVRESKSSEHNYLNWELTISDGEYEGRKQWMITSLSPRALFRLKDVFEELGFDVEDEAFELDWDDDVEITPSAGPLLLSPDVAGMPCTIVVTVEPYNGEDRNRVDNLFAAEDEAPRKASSAKRSSGNGSSGASAAKKSSGSRRALR